jgi:dolichyl-phosphate beta-glucosyltransferase
MWISSLEKSSINTMIHKVLLIIPCYNEESRLDIKSFQSAPAHIEFLFANDGSSDGTQKILDNLKKDNSRFHVFHAPHNLGKANVIQSAYQVALKNNALASYEWIGFWDADLATPLEAVDQMLRYQEFYEGKVVDSLWGSRNSRLGSNIKRAMHRHYLNRIFVTINSVLLGVKAYDSQCGAKLFRAEAAKIAFESPFISRWIFDIEILLRLKNQMIVEFPLMKWEDVPGSKVKVFKEIFRVFLDILKIRKHYITGKTQV